MKRVRKIKTLVTIDYNDDSYDAVQDDDKTHIYGPDGDKIITYFMNSGANIDAENLRLILDAYYRGLSYGKIIGEENARCEIRQVLGIES